MTKAWEKFKVLVPKVLVCLSFANKGRVKTKWPLYLSKHVSPKN